MAPRLSFAVALLAFVTSDAARATATWTSIGPEGAVVLAIAADPVTDHLVYAGVQGGGVFRSDPARSTFWHAANTGLGDLNVRALATSPAGGGVVLAGTGSGTATPVFSLLDSAVAPTKTFAGTGTGLLVSTNEGSSWALSGGGLPAAEVYALAEDPASSAIYAGGAAGVFESLDGGATWHPAADGLTNPFVLSLEVLPNGTLLAGTRAGSIFRRSDTSIVPRDPVERSAGRDETRELPFRSEN